MKIRFFEPKSIAQASHMLILILNPLHRHRICWLWACQNLEKSLWVYLGRLWGPFGSLLGPFGVLWGHFGGPWAPLGITLEHFGIIWDGFGSLFGHFESHMEILAIIWSPFSVFVENTGSWYNCKGARNHCSSMRIFYSESRRCFELCFRIDCA